MVTDRASSRPRVSVVIPTYNRANFIGPAIRSALDQSYQDFEIVVVDDGSTDNTADVVRPFASDKMVYSAQPNGGRSTARNHALALARGEYIAFLDSDDEFLPGRLERQVAILDAHQDFGMVYGSAIVVDEKGTELYKVDKDGNRHLYYEATASGWIYDQVAFYLPVTVILPSVMLRRTIVEQVGGFDERMHRFEDTDYWRRISKVTQAWAIREPVCRITAHPGNRMEHPRIVYRALDYYVSKILEEDRDEPLGVRRRGIARLYLHYGFAVVANPEYYSWHALPFFARAFLFAPIAFSHLAARILSANSVRVL